jgi:hypothetical protein
VDLARQPLPLGQHARPSLRLGQLSPRRLELRDQPPALLALRVNRLRHRDEEPQRKRHRPVEDEQERIDASPPHRLGRDQDRADGDDARERPAHRPRSRAGQVVGAEHQQREEPLQDEECRPEPDAEGPGQKRA